MTLLGLMVVTTASAAAQEPQFEGWWLGVGYGVGWKVSGPGADAGFVFQYAIGHTVSRSVRTGIGVVDDRGTFLPWKTGEDLANVTADVILDLQRSVLGPHLRLGAGLGLDDNDVGFGVTLGASWSLSMSKRDIWTVEAVWMLQAVGPDRYHPERPSTNHMLGVVLTFTRP
jgi:hypothetical protein